MAASGRDLGVFSCSRHMAKTCSLCATQEFSAVYVDFARDDETVVAVHPHFARRLGHFISKHFGGCRSYLCLQHVQQQGQQRQKAKDVSSTLVAPRLARALSSFAFLDTVYDSVLVLSLFFIVESQRCRNERQQQENRSRCHNHLDSVGHLLWHHSRNTRPELSK